jgi:hypothetical protein
MTTKFNVNHLKIGLVIISLFLAGWITASNAQNPNADLKENDPKYNPANYWLPDAPIRITRPINVPTNTDELNNLSNLLKITREPTILQALTQLSQSPYKDSVQNLYAHQGRVIYKDLRLIDKSVGNYDALSWISPEGQWMIFINHHHKGAPIQALASLLAHETIHFDIDNSIHEEIIGWQREADAWSWFVDQQGLSANAAEQWPLIKRLETLRKAKNTPAGIKTLVESNPGYQNLPKS